jgi:hypothetical protein
MYKEGEMEEKNNGGINEILEVPGGIADDGMEKIEKEEEK